MELVQLNIVFVSVLPESKPPQKDDILKGYKLIHLEIVLVMLDYKIVHLYSCIGNVKRLIGLVGSSNGSRFHDQSPPHH